MARVFSLTLVISIVFSTAQASAASFDLKKDMWVTAEECFEAAKRGAFLGSFVPDADDIMGPQRRNYSKARFLFEGAIYQFAIIYMTEDGLGGRAGCVKFHLIEKE